MPSKIINGNDKEIIRDLTKMFPTLNSAKLIFRHTDNKIVDKYNKNVSTTSTALFHERCDN